jgi:hypothetical protein
MTHDPDEIAEKIVALRELTKSTGTETTRSQNQILRALPDDVLGEVAVRIKRLTQTQVLVSSLSGR